MIVKLFRKTACAAEGPITYDPLISFLEMEFLQFTQKTMQPIGTREEARRMKQPFLQFLRTITLSSPPIRPMVESNLPILHDQLNKLYRLLRRSVPACSQE